MTVIDVSEEEWLEGLRSGLYEQNLKRDGYLRTEKDTYCCLGVMCELESKLTWSEHELAYSAENYGGRRVIAYAALGTGFRPSWMTESQEFACIHANDRLEMSFREIADWWESTNGAVRQGKHGVYYPAV